MNESLLFLAVWSHAIPNARILLEAGADINHLDSNKRPPIDLAMGIGYYEMVFFLLSSGADPCIQTNGYDLAGMMKEFGTRGVSEKEYPHFLRVVAELKKRQLITDEDIKQADNKKPFSDPQP